MRLEVAKLTGALNVTNERLNNLIKALEKQGANRRWMILTSLSAVGTVAVLLTFLVTALMRI